MRIILRVTEFSLRGRERLGETGSNKGREVRREEERGRKESRGGMIPRSMQGSGDFLCQPF